MAFIVRVSQLYLFNSPHMSDALAAAEIRTSSRSTRRANANFRDTTHERLLRRNALS